MQRNSEESWCVRRETKYRCELVETDAASLGKDRVLLAVSVASLPQEPLGPGGCCLVALATRAGPNIKALLAWNDIAEGLVAVFKQLHLVIEESYSLNNGQTKGGGENHFVKHPSSLYLTLV